MNASASPDASAISYVECSSRAAVLLAKYTDPVRIALQHLGRPIRRSVVNDNNFLRRKSLTKHAIERFHNIGAGVESGHNGRDTHLSVSTGSPPPCECAYV